MKLNFSVITKKVIDQFEKDYNEKHDSCYNQIISTLIRRRRLEKNLTLREASDTICSISYLSKIESNKVIPNDSCMRLLMERLDISNNEIIVLENSDELLKKAFNCYANLDVKKYKNLFELVDGVKNNQTVNIIKIGYYVMVNELDEAKELIRECSLVIGTISGSLIKYLMLYTVEYLLAAHEYDKIEEPIDSLLSTDMNYNMLFLVKDLQFRYSIQRGRTAQGTKLYSELLSYYINSDLILRLERTKKEYLKLLFEDKEYSLIVSDDIKNIYLRGKNISDETNMIYGISYYNLNKKIEAKQYFDEISLDSDAFNESVLYRYEVEGKKKIFVDRVLEKFKYDQSFYLYYFLSLTSDTVSIETFESEYFFKQYQKSDYYQRIKLLNLKKDFLISIFRYKEASKISQEIDRLLN